MAVVPFVEGGGAVMIMVSHSVADGGAIFTSIVDAVSGRKRDYGYSQPHSRTRRQAVREDLKSTAASLPELAKAVRAAVRVARKEKADIRSSAKRSVGRPIEGTASAIPVPSVTALVDIAEWDQRAAALGGTSNALVAGIAARLGRYRGRVDEDGLVTLNMPVSDRTKGDTRANALSGVSVKVDPEEAPASLKRIRADIKTSLTANTEAQNELYETLALTPFVPKRLLRKLEGVALGSGYPVGCTNMGDVPPDVLRADGTVAQVFFARSPIEWPVTPEILDNMGGSLVVGSARVGPQVVLVASGWQVGTANNEGDLADQLLRAVDDFGLSGTLF